MAAYLVTGNPGSGKSTVAAELARRGFTAIDADYDPKLSHWETPDGGAVGLDEAPLAPDRMWLETHRWVWDRSRLAEIVDSDALVFLCGIALNIASVADLFDVVLVLEMDEHTQEDRLAAHDAMHPPGRTEAGRQQVRDARTRFQDRMTALGAKRVDAARPTSVVVDEILEHIGVDRP